MFCMFINLIRKCIKQAIENDRKLKNMNRELVKLEQKSHPNTEVRPKINNRVLIQIEHSSKRTQKLLAETEQYALLVIIISFTYRTGANNKDV